MASNSPSTGNADESPLPKSARLTTPEATDISVGQVYTYDRSDDQSDPEQLRVVYVDDERVLCRSNRDRPRQTGTAYHLDERDTFERRVAEGLYNRVVEPDSPPRLPDGGLTAALAVLKRLRDELSRTDSRKKAHMAEGLNIAINQLEDLQPEEQDWTTVDGVGPALADRLEDHGITTNVDLVRADNETLLSINGVGEGTVEALRSHVA